jgi:beta-galactosidase/beta-glucuronidase
VIQKLLNQKFFFLLFLLISSVAICQNNQVTNTRKIIDLSGTWQFKLDTSKAGIEEKWYQKSFEETIVLPGTLDENNKGFLNKDTTEYHLNRVYIYDGPAWFKKEIEIPDDWQNKNIQLIMERTKVTHVWIDSTYLGNCILFFLLRFMS